VDSLGGGVDGDVAGDFWEEGESGAAFVYCEEGRDLAGGYEDVLAVWVFERRGYPF
jgi:hypothetical protein